MKQTRMCINTINKVEMGSGIKWGVGGSEIKWGNDHFIQAIAG